MWRSYLNPRRAFLSFVCVPFFSFHLHPLFLTPTHQKMHQRNIRKAETSSNTAIYAPATVDTQWGGGLFDRTNVRVATSRYVPRRMVEGIILLGEVFFLNVPEWILGERNVDGRPLIEERIANSVAASRRTMAEAVAQGERRKVAVLTGGIFVHK